MINPIFKRLPFFKVTCKILQIVKFEERLFFPKSSNLSLITTNFYYLSLKKKLFSIFFAFAIFKEIQSSTKIRIFVGIKYKFIYDIFRSYHIQVKVKQKSNIMGVGKTLINNFFWHLGAFHIFQTSIFVTLSTFVSFFLFSW